MSCLNMPRVGFLAQPPFSVSPLAPEDSSHNNECERLVLLSVGRRGGMEVLLAFLGGKGEIYW